MKVWLIKTGEPLPCDGSGVRLFRTGLLAEQFLRKGHKVVWWSSTFDHARKRQRYPADTTLPLAEGFQLIMLHSPGYSRNISLARVWDHWVFERRLSLQFRREPGPALVVSAFPVPAFCAAAVRYGRLNNVPVVLDIRDLWPDAHLELLPRWARPLGKFALSRMLKHVRIACRGAVALTAPTREYLEWGLFHAGRERSDPDGVFPMGYPDGRPTSSEASAARDYWSEKLRLDKAERVFVCCFFGALSHQFDFETVLNAAQILESEKRDFRFVLCGRGDRLDELKGNSQGLRSVVFPGWVESPEIWELMRIAKVGLAPYQDSPRFTKHLPNKPVEYMAGGLVTVSSLRGLLAELLVKNDCGLTYRTADSVHLASLLRGLYDNPGRVDEMAGNARRLFEERYVASAVYGRMVDHLVQSVGAMEPE